MNRFLSLLVFFLLAQAYAFSQSCVPDPSFTEPGIYPPPFNENSNPNGGITEPACIGQPFSFQITVINPTEIPGLEAFGTIDSVVLNSVSGLPAGLSFSCGGSCSAPGGGSECLVLSGIPNASNTPGKDTIVISTTIYFSGGAVLPVSLPSPDAPGDLYIIDVRDASCTPNDCDLQVNFAPTNATCFTAQDGGLTANVTGGTAPYTYQWDAAVGNQTGATVTGLGRGNYSVTVTDAEGCEVEAEGQVSSPSGSVFLDIPVSSVTNVECGVMGSATVNVTGNSLPGPYTFLWSNGEMNATATMLPAGENSVTVTSASGCGAVESVTIQDNGGGFDFSINKMDVKCPGGNGGGAQVSITGGNAGATFIWFNGNTTNSVTGLSAGNYDVTILKDGCELTETVVIEEPDPIAINFTNRNDASCEGTSKGRATANASGGNGGPFTYDWPGGQTSATVTGLDPGTYEVTATDAEGCTSVESVEIGGLSEPITITVTTEDVTCNGDTDGSAMITVMGDGGGFSYTWPDGNTNASRNNLAAGSYQVTISKNGCEATRTITINDPTPINTGIQKTDAVCDGSSLGAITANPSGGSGGYTYNWSGPGVNNETGNEIRDLQAGTYQLTVTDSDGCTTSETVTISETGSGASFAINKTDQNCFGTNDGTASVVVPGGNTNLSFQWNDPNNTAAPTVSNLAPGTYQVVITDSSNGCSSTESVTIGAASEIQLNVQATDGDCTNGTLTSLSVTASGGAGDYTYLWSNNGETTASISGVPTDTYMVTVTDANNCMVVASESVEYTGLFDVEFDKVDASCGSNTADGGLAVTQPPGNNFSFDWSNGETTRTITNLSPGEYTVTVTDDNTGCSAVESITVNSATEINTQVSITDLSCDHVVRGRVEVTPSGGSGNFSFEWSNGAVGTAVIDDLDPGTYTLTITDQSSNCVQEVSAVVGGNPIPFDARLIVNDISCTGETDGRLTVAASGGAGNYSYTWSDSQVGASIINLGVGSYSVTVQDGEGCTATLSGTIAEPSLLFADIEENKVSCFGDSDGSAEITVFGGTGDYSFAYPSNLQVGNTAMPTGLPAGTFEVTITDENQCSLVESITIDTPGELSATFSTTQDACNGSGVNSITANPVGGTGPYTYIWDNQSQSTNRTINDITRTNYSVTITDGNGCEATNSISVTPGGNAFSAILDDVQDVSCNGLADGSATINVSGGSGNYDYAWSFNNPSSDPSSASNLAAGVYAVTVTDLDNSGCADTFLITIEQPDVLALSLDITDVACPGEANGEVLAEVEGGTAPYTYNWTNSNDNTDQLINLGPELLFLTVTDANGCTDSIQGAINEPNPLIATIEAVGADDCADLLPEGLTAVTTGGTGMTTFEWSTGETIDTLRDIMEATYFLTVTDSRNCEAFDTIQVVENTNVFQVDDVLVNDPSCTDDNNGTASVNVTGGSGNYNYAWSSGTSTTSAINSLSAGDYSVTITDQDGSCEEVKNFTISNPLPLTVDIVVDGFDCPGDTGGSLIAVVDNNQGNPSYSWSTTGTNASITNLDVDTYSITVTDQLGCTTSKTINIADSISTFDIDFTVNGQLDDCSTVLPDAITATAFGNRADTYTFSWSTTDTTTETDTSSTITQPAAGLYTVIVTNSKGCSQTDTFEVTENTNIFSINDEVVEDISCAGADDGSITFTVAGGSGNYNYNWEQASLQGNNVTGLAGGTYTVTISDQAGDCESVRTFTINEPDALQLDFNVMGFGCANDTDGMLSVNVQNGVGNLTYDWSTSATTATISDLMPTTYTVTVTDGNNCEATATINLADSVSVFDVSISAISDNNSCVGGLPDSIVATITGSMDTYTFDWSAGTSVDTDLTSTVSSLEEGMYQVVVTNSIGCTDTASIQIDASTNGFSVNVEVTNLSCPGTNDGIITLTPSGGSGSYNFDWSSSPVGNQVNLPGLGSLQPGLYTIFVDDGGECRDTVVAEIINPEPVRILAISQEPPSCTGLSDGSAAFTAVGGTGALNLVWQGVMQNGLTIDGLPAGQYPFMIEDENGCTFTDSLLVTEPDSILATFTPAKGGCDGRFPEEVQTALTGGTGAYTYSWSDGSTNDTLAVSAVGTYTLTITDENGCTAVDSVQVTTDSLDLAVEIATTDIPCTEMNSGTIDLTVSGGSGIYDYAWSNGDTLANLTALPQGDYFVTISDQAGCERIDTITIQQVTSFDVNVETVSESCPTSSDGRVTVTTDRGGITDFTYAYSGSSSTTSVASGLDGGNYVVTVTEKETGCTATQSFTIEEPDEINIFDIDIDNLVCFGDDNGRIIVEVQGGSGALEVDWSNGGTDAFNAMGGRDTLDGLVGGTYILTVTDALGCETTKTYEITRPEQIRIDLAVNDAAPNLGGSATANVTGGSGAGTYTFMWVRQDGQSFSNQTNMITGLEEGAYTVFVTDRNGCTNSESFTVGGIRCVVPIDLDFDITQTDCNGENGSITVDANGGFLPYTFAWSTQDTVRTIDSLVAGEYQITVFDDRGCPAIETIELRDAGAIAVAFTNNQPESCVGQFDGSVRAIVNGLGPFDYNWVGYDETSSTLSGLTAGEIALIVTNRQGCTEDATVTIERLDEMVAEVTAGQNISCTGANDGAATISIEGGEAPYTFLWEDGGMGATRDSLSVGATSVTITEANGCQISTSVNISEPNPIQATVETTDASCFSISNGSAMVETASGGTGDLNYIWPGDTIATPNASIINLDEGDYELTVVDENGCEQSVPFTITMPDSITLSVTSTNETAPNANDGTATVEASGGTPPYQYAWDNDDTSETATGLAPGTSFVTVTDNNGCIQVGSVNVNGQECTIRIADIDKQDLSCNGDNSGSATVVISNNISESIIYDWGGGRTGSTITGLSAGTYTVTVTEENGCTATEAVVINEPAAIAFNDFQSVVNIDCVNASGRATATAIGGTGTITYRWSTGENSSRAINLLAGVNTVTATDSEGCTATATVTITEVDVVDLNITASTDVACFGDNTGSATVSASGGNGNYSYAWEDGVSNSESASNLGAGSYIVTVTDTDNCSTTITVTINEPDELTSNVQTTDVACFGENTGAATISVSGGTMPYSYTWPSNISSTAEAANLPKGSTTVTITDANNCTIQQMLTIDGPDEALTIDIVKADESTQDANDGQAQVTATGGTGAYTYDWGDAGNTQLIENLEPGEYTVTVTDANGCTATATINILPGGFTCTAFNVEATATAPVCSNEEGGMVEVTSVDGEGPFTYAWSTAGADTSRMVMGVAPGTYTVTVTTEFGCTSEQTVTVEEIAELLAEFEVENVNCEGGANGRVNLLVVGGTMPYSYIWSTGGNSENSRDSLDSGDYIVTIEDAAGCQEIIEFSIDVEADTIPPIAAVNDMTVYLDEFGEAMIEAEMINSGSTDDCSLDAFRINGETQLVFDCDQLGSNEISFTVTDRAGNSSAATAFVTVLDTIRPLLMCMQEDVLITNCNAERTVNFDTPQAIDNCSGVPTVELIQGLPSGSVFPPGVTEQVFVVTDESGNSDTCSFVVDINVLDLQITPTPPSCFGFADGSLAADAINAEGETFYSWSTTEDTKVITGLAAGEYSVTVIDQQGCTREQTITLENPPLLTVEVDSVARVNDTLVSIFAIAEGGTPPLNYQWGRIVGTATELISNQGQQNLLNVLDGEYRLTVFDANGCNVTTQKVVTSTDTYDINYGVNIRPNPTSGVLNFEINQNYARAYTVDLFDVNGQHLERLVNQKEQLPNQQFDLSNYKVGVYFIKIQVANQVLTERIVLIRE